MQTARIIALWICGLIAGAFLGGALDVIGGSDEAGLGMVGGPFAFAAARLWYVLRDPISN